MSRVRWRLEKKFNQEPNPKDFHSGTLPGHVDAPAGSVYEAERSKRRRHNPNNDDYRQSAEFLNSDSGLGPPNWYGRRLLGTGGAGRAGLWERVDRDGEPFQRIVIKQQRPIGEARYLWKNSSLPKELITMFQLNALNCRNIVRIMDFKNYPSSNVNDRRWRFYFEYCPHGDLQELKQRYVAFAQYFPESFLWHVFKDLMGAVKTMRKGPFRDEAWKQDRALEMVHFDIKAENIFIGDEHAESSNIFDRTYPTMKMGDFGAARITRPNATGNPSNMTNMGTTWYFPPEQDANSGVSLHNMYPDLAGQPFDSQTNLWGAAMLMWELIHVGEWPGTSQIQHRNDGHTVREIRTGKVPEYSNELRSLIRDCLRIHPARRPSVDEVERIIDTKLRDLAREALTNNDIDDVKFRPGDFRTFGFGDLPLNADDVENSHLLRDDDFWKCRNFITPWHGFDNRKRRIVPFIPEDRNPSLTRPSRRKPEYPRPLVDPSSVKERVSRLRNRISDVFGEDASVASVSSSTGPAAAADEESSSETPTTSTGSRSISNPTTAIYRQLAREVDPEVRSQYSFNFRYGHFVLPTTGDGRARGYNAINYFLRSWKVAEEQIESDLDNFLGSPTFRTYAGADQSLCNIDIYNDIQLAGLLYHWGTVQPNNLRLRLCVLRPLNDTHDVAYFPFVDSSYTGEQPTIIWIRNMTADGGPAVWAKVRAATKEEKDQGRVLQNVDE